MMYPQSHLWWYYRKLKLKLKGLRTVYYMATAVHYTVTTGYVRLLTCQCDMLMTSVTLLLNPLTKDVVTIEPNIPVFSK
jgi:hypothetical protein